MSYKTAHGQHNIQTKGPRPEGPETQELDEAEDYR